MSNPQIETDETRHGIGGNNPPEGVALIQSTLRQTETIELNAHGYLQIEHSDLMRRYKEIVTSLGTIPAKIDDKVAAEKLSDIRFAIKKWVTAAKAARTAEKKPWDNIAKVFYAFFTRPIETLEEADDKKIAPVLQDWQEREAARARREAEEIARQQREEAEKRTREAREAEERRLAAERAEREAKEAAERAERERLAEIERAAKARAEKERQEKEAAEAAARAIEQQRLADEARARREEEERRAAEAKAEKDAAEARIAAARAEEERARAAADKADADRRASEEAAARAKAEEDAAKQAAKAAREAEKTAEREAVAARKDQREATRDGKDATADAARAGRKADKAEDIATGSVADLSRIRGEAGSVSSLRTFWNFRELDRAKLNLEELRQHLPISALETAIRSFIDAGGRKLDGVQIFEDTGTTTR